MARWVDAELLAKAYLDVAKEEHLTGLLFISPEDVANTILRVSEKLDEVAPVIHANWEIIYESSAGVTDARCSNCGCESLAYENDVHTDENCNYCPCCGAKMDEEVKS